MDVGHLDAELGTRWGHARLSPAETDRRAVDREQNELDILRFGIRRPPVAKVTIGNGP